MKLDCGHKAENYIIHERIYKHIQVYKRKEKTIRKDVKMSRECFDCYIGNTGLIGMANPINENGPKKKEDWTLSKDNSLLKKRPDLLSKWKEYKPE